MHFEVNHRCSLVALCVDKELNAGHADSTQEECHSSVQKAQACAWAFFLRSRGAYDAVSSVAAAFAEAIV